MIEIISGQIKNGKRGSYLSLSCLQDGKSVSVQAFAPEDVAAFSGPGKYDGVLKTEPGKDGKMYTNVSGLKLISQAPVTPGGTSVSSLDPNSLIRERASTARAAMMCAKDIAIARGDFNVTTVCEIANSLFKEMQALSTGKPMNKEAEK